MMDDRVIYIRWSDDGRFIRKWDTKPFDGAEPMYSRSWLLSEERVEAIARQAYIRGYDEGAVDQVEGGAHPDARTEGWVQYRDEARAALSSAIGEPYEFSGWVEVVEDDRA